MTPNVALIDRPTALYRFYDCAGSLLYIGITCNPKARFAQHAATQPWWKQVDHDRTTITWHSNRLEAEALELAAIRDEQPRHNIVTSDEYGCARFLPAPPGVTRGRPNWSPTTSEQRKAIQAARRSAQRAADLEDELWAAIQAARDLGVPARYMAQRIKRGKTTVYRHVPPKPDGGGEPVT